MKTDFQHRICFVRFANSESGTFFLVKMIFFAECWVLPITVFLAVAAYAILAALFYNTDG